MDLAAYEKILEALLVNTTLQTLNLGLADDHDFNQLTTLPQVLQRNHTLTNLSLVGNEVNDETMALIIANPFITKLDLASTDIGGSPKALNNLKDNQTLQSLRLRNNRLNVTAINNLADFITQNQSLQSLNLKQCGLSLLALIQLSNALGCNHSLTELDLSDNDQVGNDGARALAEVLKANSRLKTLKLANCTITNNGAQALMNGLLLNISLTELDLDFSVYQLNGGRGIHEHWMVLIKRMLERNLYIDNHYIKPLAHFTGNMLDRMQAFAKIKADFEAFSPTTNKGAQLRSGQLLDTAFNNKRFVDLFELAYHLFQQRNNPQVLRPNRDKIAQLMGKTIDFSNPEELDAAYASYKELHETLERAYNPRLFAQVSEARQPVVQIMTSDLYSWDNFSIM